MSQQSGRAPPVCARHSLSALSQRKAFVDDHHRLCHIRRLEFPLFERSPNGPSPGGVRSSPEWAERGISSSSFVRYPIRRDIVLHGSHVHDGSTSVDRASHSALVRFKRKPVVGTAKARTWDIKLLHVGRGCCKKGPGTLRDACERLEPRGPHDCCTN